MKSRTLLIVFILLLLPVAMEAQCSMCRAVLTANADDSPAKGINDGIIYLMAFPYILMAGVGFAVWRSYKKRKAQD